MQTFLSEVSDFYREQCKFRSLNIPHLVFDLSNLNRMKTIFENRVYCCSLEHLHENNF